MKRPDESLKQAEESGILREDQETRTQQNVSVQEEEQNSREEDEWIHSINGHGCTDPQQFILPKCFVPPENVMRPVETFVARAISSQHEETKDGVMPQKEYKAILEIFRSKNDAVMLQRLMIALRTAGNGSTLHLLTSHTSKHTHLIHQIIRLDPFNLPHPQKKEAPVDDCAATDATEVVDYTLADAQFHLIIALVSANSVFLVPALAALWNLLTRKIDDAPKPRTQRIHAALATIIRLCPKAGTELFPIISSNTPYRIREATEITWYYRQCLTVLQYLPSLEGQVLELMIDKSLEMDVDIKIADNGEASFDDDKDDELDVFEMDSPFDQTKKVVLPLDAKVSDMAERLDCVMVLLFMYAEVRAGDENYAYTKVIYDILSRIFEASILITHKSKFVQFVILQICGLEVKAHEQSSNFRVAVSANQQEPAPPLQLLYRDFATKLIDVVLDPYRATVTRQSGACYLASFVSRATYVCPETVCETVNALLRWAEAYIQSIEDKSASIGMHAANARDQCQLHSLFYTVCQSAFYVMCFRGVEAIRFYRNVAAGAELANSSSDIYNVEVEHVDVGPHRWTNLCAHPLRPLRYCLESVCSEFLSLARIFKLIDDSTLKQLAVDGNRRSSPASSSVRPRRKKSRKAAISIQTPATLEKERLDGGVGGLGRGTNPLDSFFPFDPYLLRRSHRFVEPFYNHWTGSIEEAAIAEEELAIRKEAHDFDDDDESDLDSNYDESGDECDLNSEAPVSDVNRSMNLTSSLAVADTLGCSSTTATLEKQPDTQGSLKEAWINTLKRARAPSIETGSW